MKSVTDTWQAVRGLRAEPTGAAAMDANRRKTFAAALRQAEELAEAAAAAGYAARPLPLFYSLSQAGRAIAAAHLSSDWELRGHGLKVKPYTQNGILETAVEPTGHGNDSFSKVASAIDSPRLGGKVVLGELWAANPDLRDVPIPNPIGAWPTSLELPIGTQTLYTFNAPGPLPDPETHPFPTDGIVGMSVILPGETGQEITDALRPYPTLSDAFGVKQGDYGGEPAGPSDPVVRGPDLQGVLRPSIGKSIDRTATAAEFWRRQRDFASFVEIDDRYPVRPHPHYVGYALPALGGTTSPHPLMLWWALLLALSSLARYEPAAWTEAINLDSSPLAVSLERILDVATERVPKRILDSLQ